MKTTIVSILLTALALLAWAQGVMAQDQAKLFSLDPQPGRGSIYELSFTTIDTLRPTACFEIVFPASYDISDVRLAGSSTINGGFNVVTSGDTVRVERSGLGRSVAPGEKVDLKIASVRNPKESTSGQRAGAVFYHEGKGRGRRFTTVMIPLVRSIEENQR